MKKISIKVFWVGVVIALALLLLLVSIVSPEKYNAVQTMVAGFVIGFVTYAIATKLYTL